MGGRIFISVDMEGIAGINTDRQGSRGSDDYPWARELMTEEANAAVAGAYDGGADSVVVSDSHGDMANILPHRLDQRADLVQGTPKAPLSMMTGVEPGHAGAIFIGYHAGAATQTAVLDHTYSGVCTDVRVNGESWSETAINAAIAGTMDVPVMFVAGDEACCSQAEATLKGVHTLAVKRAYGARVSVSMSPERARVELRAAVAQAVREGASIPPFQPAPPFRLEMDFRSTMAAGEAEIVPSAERVGPLTVAYDADDVMTLYRAFIVMLSMAQWEPSTD